MGKRARPNPRGLTNDSPKAESGWRAIEPEAGDKPEYGRPDPLPELTAEEIRHTNDLVQRALNRLFRMSLESTDPEARRQFREEHDALCRVLGGYHHVIEAAKIERAIGGKTTQDSKRALIEARNRRIRSKYGAFLKTGMTERAAKRKLAAEHRLSEKQIGNIILEIS